MELIKQISSSRSVLIKLAGLVFLVSYFISTRFSFDVVWLLMAMMVSFGGFLFYILSVVTFNHERNVEAVHEQQQFIKSKNTLDSYLPGMEDGVFLLPLLFVGVNLFTVTLAVIFYGVANYRHISTLYLCVKMLSYFIIGLWILPYGIWPVLLAHIIVDTLITYNLSNWLTVKEDRNVDDDWDDFDESELPEL